MLAAKMMAPNILVLQPSGQECQVKRLLQYSFYTRLRYGKTLVDVRLTGYAVISGPSFAEMFGDVRLSTKLRRSNRV
jgi:hypothetical protein